ncbi:MAG: nucleotidyltransferase domain-containing protein [Phototrophicaceae bacterium]
MKFKSIQDLQPYRAQILRLADEHGALDVRIFGSVARGDATDTSDLDVLVRWDYTNVSAWGGVGFDIDLQDLLGCHVDVISEAAINPKLKAQILSEARSL